eukprot:ANDGO_00865.mRNA.1 hypothetical protein
MDTTRIACDGLEQGLPDLQQNATRTEQVLNAAVENVRTYNETVAADTGTFEVTNATFVVGATVNEGNYGAFLEVSIQQPIIDSFCTDLESITAWTIVNKDGQPCGSCYAGSCKRIG